MRLFFAEINQKNTNTLQSQKIFYGLHLTYTFYSLLIFSLLMPSFIVSAQSSSSTGQIPFKDFKEPELFAQQKTSDIQIYRLMILPTWGDQFCIRFEKSTNGANMILKRLKVCTDRKDGTLAESKEYKLTNTEFTEFEELVAKSEYKKMKEFESLDGLDGEWWIMEVSKADFYHAVVRWCPNAYDPKKRGTKALVAIFHWAFDKAGVLKDITNKGHLIFNHPNE